MEIILGGVLMSTFYFNGLMFKVERDREGETHTHREVFVRAAEVSTRHRDVILLMKSTLAIL